MAAFYLISLALGVLMVSIRGSSVDLMHVLFGTVLALNNEALMLIGGIAAVTLAQPRHLLAGAGRRMPRSAVPALGQPARQPGAFHLPRPRRAQPRRRLPGARHAALGRPDDAAGRGRALLDRARRADVRAGRADRLRLLRRRAARCPITPRCPPARRSSCRPASIYFVSMPVRHARRVCAPASSTTATARPEPDPKETRHAEIAFAPPWR